MGPHPHDRCSSYDGDDANHTQVQVHPRFLLFVQQHKQHMHYIAHPELPVLLVVSYILRVRYPSRLETLSVAYAPYDVELIAHEQPFQEG